MTIETDDTGDKATAKAAPQTEARGASTEVAAKATTEVVAVTEAKAEPAAQATKPETPETAMTEPAKSEASETAAGAVEANAARSEAAETEAPKAEPANPGMAPQEAPQAETSKPETPGSEAPTSEAPKAETASKPAAPEFETKIREPVKSEPVTPPPAPEVEPVEVDAVKAPEPAPVAPPVVVEARSEASGESSSLFRRRATLQSPTQTLQPQSPPPPPPPKKKKRREGMLSATSGFLSFLLVALVAGAFGFIAVMHKLKEPGPLAADKVVYIPPRSDVPEMLAQLEREGVIDSPGLMNFAVLVEGARGKLKQGEYLFKKKISLREVIDELVAGRQLMHSLTIPEGLTSEQIMQRLRESDLLVGEVIETPKEGALLPETYKFPRGFPRARLVAKMQEDQRKLVEHIWAKRAKDIPLRTPFELVTLASIVEKETGKPEERPRVAAVFMNRLRKHMRLQSDPTIVYGLVGGKASLGRGILRSEIEKWTPYNTYAIDGLPPGPIANPGKAALEATANPANTRDLYFVADGTGGHVFSDSLEGHSRNVQQWRRIEKDQKEKDEADKAAPAAVPPATPRSDKRTEAPIGRLVDIAGRHEDFSPGRTMSPDDDATHRLGKFGPDGAAFFLGGIDDPTAPAAPHLAALRPARPYFTEDAAQPRARSGGFDPALLAAGAAPAGEGEEGAGFGADVGMARESADGRALPDDLAEIAAYPVSAARRADQKARAAKLGLSSGSDELPSEALGEKVAAEEAPATPAVTPAAMAAAPQRVRPRAFDASEGTALDPLRDRSWDLTSAKTVPAGASFR